MCISTLECNLCISHERFISVYTDKCFVLSSEGYSKLPEKTTQHQVLGFKCYCSLSKPYEKVGGLVGRKKHLQDMNHKETYDCCIRLVVVILARTPEYNLGLLITSFPTEKVK